MPFYFDQLERKLFVPNLPQRIVSVVPSQTELLHDLGLENEVVGITKFCVHPEQWFHTKKRVGGTKQLKLDVIRNLQPDLILANKEENTREQIEELGRNYPVWISDVSNTQQALDMITTVGHIVGRQARATSIVEKIREDFAALQNAKDWRSPSCVYLIWKDPMLTVGGDTFISHMLEKAGFLNAFAHRCRYPEVNADDINSVKADFIFLSSEPYPFREQHLTAFARSFPAQTVLLVDGEIFSWYGSRMLQAGQYFQALRDKIRALSVF